MAVCVCGAGTIEPEAAVTLRCLKTPEILQSQYTCTRTLLYLHHVRVTAVLQIIHNPNNILLVVLGWSFSIDSDKQVCTTHCVTVCTCIRPGTRLSAVVKMSCLVLGLLGDARMTLPVGVPS